MRPERELARLLSNAEPFAHCRWRDLRLVARHADRLRVRSGTTLVHEGEPCQTWFVLLSGRAEMRCDGVAVRHLRRSDTFDDVAVVTGERATASVITTTDVDLAVFGARSFRALIREIPTIGLSLLGVLARRSVVAIPPTPEVGR